jgi:hypothetical protein
MKYTIEDTFDVSPARYWQVFFDDEYNRALWPYLNIECKPLKLERTGEGDDLRIVREQHLTPKREVPAIIAKFVKGAISYTERNEFTARTNSMRTTTTPSFMADKIHTVGTYRLDVLGPEKVNRVWEGEIDVSIPLVGGKVEKLLAEEVRDSYKRATEFTRKWHAEHGAA